MDGENQTVLILGAGINGAALARELVLAGVGVWVVDTADISSGTTAYSSRLIHGGLRYLEYAEFSLVRESLTERTRLLRLAPQYVRPLQLAIPIGRRTSGLWTSVKKFLGRKTSGLVIPRGLWIVRAGLTLYDLFARDPELPKHQVDSIGRRSHPVVDSKRYRWLCSYWDAQIQYPERFVLAMFEDARLVAQESGLPFHVYPYHRASLDGAMAEVHPVANGQTPVASFAPAAIINATGAWVDTTLQELKVPSKRLMGGTKGSHFVTYNEKLSRALSGQGVYTEADDGRPVFLLPLGERLGDDHPPPATLVGTTDVPFDGDPGEVVASAEEIDYLLRTANHVVPDVKLTGADIDFHYCGVRPLPYVGSSSPAGITRQHRLEENTSCPVPFYSIIGGKLTTCRSLAEETAETILEKLRLPTGRTSRDRVIPGGEAYPSDSGQLSAAWDRLAEQFSLERAQIAAIWPLLGTRTETILREAGTASDGNLTDTLLPCAVVRWIIHNEWVTTLNDLVERRLMLLYHRHLSRACLRDAATLLAEAGHIADVDLEDTVARTVEYLQNRYGKRVRDNR